MSYLSSIETLETGIKRYWPFSPLPQRWKVGLFVVLALGKLSCFKSWTSTIAQREHGGFQSLLVLGNGLVKGTPSLYWEMKESGSYRKDSYVLGKWMKPPGAMYACSLTANDCRAFPWMWKVKMFFYLTEGLSLPFHSKQVLRCQPFLVVCHQRCKPPNQHLRQKWDNCKNDYVNQERRL